MLEWLFKFSSAEYARGELLFTSDWPRLWGLALLCLGALALALLAWRRGRALGVPRLAVLWLLQVAMLSLALLALWQPALLFRTLQPGQNSIAVLLDTSSSMALPDPQQSRLQQALAALDAPPVRQLLKDYQPRRYRFDSEASPVPAFAGVAADGGATDIGDSVQQVLRGLQGTPLGALLLVSDGADNRGSLDPDQLAAIAAQGVPVHVIGVGRESLPEDLELEDVLLPQKTLPGTRLAARVSVRHDGAGMARVKAYDGERFLASTDITLPAEATLSSGTLNFELPDTGFRALRFTVDPKSGERELGNNARTRVVQVASQRASVLYVEGEARWDLKFMRRAMEHDSGVRLVTWLRTSPNGYYRQGVEPADELKDGFPLDRESLFRYDAVIVGSLPAATLKPQQLQLLRDFVSERGGSLLLLGGPNGLGAGGWGATAVGPVLPAQLSERTDTFHRAQAQAQLTPRGRRSAMLKLADDPAANDAAWNGLPKLADYQDIGALKPAAVSLLNVRVGSQDAPLLVTQPYGRGHGWILATGGTWRWQMLLPVADQRHEQFWRQLLRELVSDVPDAFAVQARSVGNRLVVSVDARDGAFAPLKDVALSAMATQGGETVPIALQPVAGQAGAWHGEAVAMHPGAYFIDVTASRGPRTVATGRTVVQHDSQDAEAFNLRQNRALLTQLARATGGRYWTPEELAGLPEAIRASAAGVTRQELRPLWDAPAVFLALIALKAAEWLLRRRWSVV